MSFTLYGYEKNPRARVIRIVVRSLDRLQRAPLSPFSLLLLIHVADSPTPQAAAEAIELQHVEVIPRKNIGKETYMARFPLSRGKIPGLEGPGIRLTETLAIASYLARISNRSQLLGDGSKEQEALVLMWMSWANQELLPTLARWFLPLIPSFTDPAPYDETAIEAGRLASLHLLDKLEDVLESRVYLVGERVTLADIMVGVFVSRGLEWVLDAEWRRGHPKTMKHFEMVAGWKTVTAVIPEFVLVEKQTPIYNPYAIS